MLTLSDAGLCVDDAWIWRRLSFDVKPGNRVAVVGPSGSGKTLLLRALAGLEPLDKGTLTLAGRGLAEWALPAYRARVMYLPQSPAFVEGTVEENLEVVFGFAVHRDKTYDREVILRHLDRLGQSARFLERDVSVLSGGEQQIVALLRALQLSPSVLLLDEPTANIDAHRTRQIEALLASWMDMQTETALVWTSHDAAQVDRMTTRRIDLAVYAATDSNSVAAAAR